MNTSAIATHDIRSKGNGMAILLNAFDPVAAETPHASHDTSFADILDGKKNKTSGDVLVSDRKNLSMSDAQSPAVVTGMPAAGAPPRALETGTLKHLSAQEGHQATRKAKPASRPLTGIDESSFSAFADITGRNATPPERPSWLAPPDLLTGTMRSISGSMGEESLFLQTGPDARTWSPSVNKGPENLLHAATK